MSSVKRSVVTGFVWQFVALLGQRLVVFVAYIFFGRSLSKAEIGVVAVATSITVFVDMLRAGGILQALIQHPNDETEVRAVSSTFWMTFFAGLGWSIVLLGIGMLLPGITGSPRIGPIMMVLASTAFMDNLRLVPMAVLSRKLRFSRRALADTIGSVCGAIVGIAALFVFEQQDKIWAIVVMLVGRSFVTTVAHYLLCPPIPIRLFDRDVARTLSKVGWRNLSSNIASGTLENLTLLAVKSRTTFEVAGIFDWAVTKVMGPPTSIAHAANNTLFPVLAQSANDPEKSRDRVLRSLRNIGIVAGGILGWLAAISPAAIPFVFGHQWTVAVLPSQIVALGILFRTYAYTCTNALLAVHKHRSATSTWWVTLFIAAALMLLWPMSRVEAITPTVIFVVFNLFACVLGVQHASAGFGFPAAAGVRAIGPTTLAGALSFALTTPLYLLPIHGPIPQIAACTAVFGLIFLAICGKISGGTWTSLFSISGLKALLKAA